MSEVFATRHAAAWSSSPRVAMQTSSYFFLFSLAVLAWLGWGSRTSLAQTPVTVPTWRYDVTHAGQNTNETELTPANVNANSFGKLFSVTTDGYMYAQPLYVPGLKMSDGLVHNVLFSASEHDSVYAFDADSNGGINANPIWHITLLDAAHGAGSGATTVPNGDTASHDITPEIGITGTPVINLANNTMYVVASTKENGVYFMRLHALDIVTGAEQSHSPIAIQATVSGTGNGSSGGQLTFSPLWQNQRPALDYYNGYVYAAFGSHGDNGPWHGWIFAYDATTLAQTAVLCTSPNGAGDGVWMAGSGLPIDDGGTAGRMFLTTGNGTFSTYPPFTSSTEIGDSTIALDLSHGGLTVMDEFTPFNQATLSHGDSDQGSGGILMVPDQQGANPHILVQVGKEGRILVLDRDNLGGYATGVRSNTNALQDILNETGGLWSTPAYWNGNVYMWASKDVPRLFSVNSGVLSTTPASKSTISSLFPGASFSISSDGTQNGVAWAVRTDQYTTHGPGVLYAWDATDLSNLLYESDTNATRDGVGQANRFAIPVVTNGKLYLNAQRQVDVYGLLHGQPTAAEPVITPDGGTFSNNQSVTLTSATSSANIYYTLDGSVPTPASTFYTEPITISENTTVNALATATGFVQSGVSSAIFTFTSQAPSVTFTPPGGAYTSTQQVTLSDTDSAAKIYYTTDGSKPTASSNAYSKSITVASSITIQAIAIDPKLQTSAISSANYMIQAGGEAIDFSNGFSNTAGLTLNGSAIATDDSRLQLTDGGSKEAGSFFWNQPIGIQAFATSFSFQLSSAQGDGFTFTIQNNSATALGENSAGLGYQKIGNSAAIKFDFYNNDGEGKDSTGVYTDGAPPTVPAVDLTASGIELNSGDSMLANVNYDGTTLTMNLLDLVTNKTFVLTQVIDIPQVVGANTAYVGFTGSTGGATASQKILYWTYAAQSPITPASAPMFSPGAGTYSTPQSVGLSSSTSGATIYYTTNGTTPTTQSSLYNGPIAVGSGSTTIEAIAVASGFARSAVATAQYVVGTPVPSTPSFSPVAGMYSSPQNVALSSATAGATIYYTTNGTTPTTASSVYKSAIAVGSGTTTIEAIAVADGSPSSVATAKYVIATAEKMTVNFASGFPSAAGLSLVDTATVAKGALQLTLAGATATKGAAWFSKPVTVSSFTTDFEFQLLSPVADGFTFTLQNDKVTAIGPGGSGLGYGASKPGSGGGITKSVAVKFDIYSNLGEGTDSTGVYLNGASPTTPASSMTASGVVLRSEHVFHAHLTYDGTNLTLVLTDTKTNASFTKTQAVNIPSTVGSSTAYVGFTGGIGGLSMTAHILNWTMTTP